MSHAVCAEASQEIYKLVLDVLWIGRDRCLMMCSCHSPHKTECTVYINSPFTRLLILNLPGDPGGEMKAMGNGIVCTALVVGATELPFRRLM